MKPILLIVFFVLSTLQLTLAKSKQNYSDYLTRKDSLIIKNFAQTIKKGDMNRALNFLALDDLSVIEEGEDVDPKSIIVLDFIKERPSFPVFTADPSDLFLKRIQDSKRKWVVLVDQHHIAHYVLDSDAFLRAVFFSKTLPSPMHYCHRPIIVADPSTSLEEVICQLKMHPHRTEDDVIDHDIILLWGDEKKVITGADILGRLLQGIISRKSSG